MTSDANNCKKPFFKNPLFTHLAVAIITGFIAVFGEFLVARSNEEVGRYTTDNQTIVSLIGKVSELQEQVSKQSLQMTVLQEENANLRRKITELEGLKNYDEFAVSTFFKFMPIPAWLKVYDNDREKFVMRRINRAYEDQWNIMNISYTGKTDHEVWDTETADMFEKHDKIVLKNLSPIITVENIPIDSKDPSRGFRDWIVAKFPVSFNGVQYNAVGGIAIPENVEEYITR